MLLSALASDPRCKMVPIWYCRQGKNTSLCHKGHCFELFFILPWTLSRTVVHSVCLKTQKKDHWLWCLQWINFSWLLALIRRETGWKVVRGKDRKRKWVRWRGQQWDSSFKCTGGPKKKGEQWSFRTCPSLVHSLAVSFYSQNRSRDHSSKSFTLILINCKPIQFLHRPLLLTSRNSVITCWNSHLHFSSLIIFPRSCFLSVFEFHNSSSSFSTCS